MQSLHFCFPTRWPSMSHRNWDIRNDFTFQSITKPTHKILKLDAVISESINMHRGSRVFQLKVPRVTSSPELCHLGFREGGFWRGYILIRYVRGSFCRSNSWSCLIQDLRLPIYQGHLRRHTATERKSGLSEGTNLRVWKGVFFLTLSTLRTHLSAGVAAGVGLLGVVGDGCSCFSMVSFTNSCLQTCNKATFNVSSQYRTTWGP